MNADSRDDRCDERTAELVRLICDEPRRPSAALQFWLETAQTAREELNESRELTRAVRAALLPEPMPASLRERIGWELAALEAPKRWGRREPFQLGVAAAAACLLVALLVPGGAELAPENEQAGGWAVIALTSEDAAVLVESSLTLSWDGSELSVKLLRGSVERVSQDLRGENASSSLPWNSGEDWDMPGGDVDASGWLQERGVDLVRGLTGSRVACDSAV